MRTPSQTVGPFFALGLCRAPQNELPEGTALLEGRVIDGAGEPVDDALVEVWNPDVGWARCGTGDGGRFRFMVPPRATRFEVMIFARGLLKPCVTRLYFDPAAADDPSMVASATPDGFRFDVRLQGDNATAFFDW